ncbi:MAG: glycosyltransferase family 2 protein [Parabacteroides sp.]
MNDLISIIVPIYNVEGYVSTCIDSLLRQTYPHLQIILVDDGSTDRSGAICDKYARQDTRIEVIHQENAGLSAARNSGLKRAIGELIAFVDGDDYVHPQMYDTLYRALRSGDYDFSMVLGKQVPDGSSQVLSLSSVFKQTVLPQERLMRGLFNLETIEEVQLQVVWNKLYKRELLEEELFQKTGTEDTEFNCRIYLHAHQAILIEEAMYYWVQRSSSITHQKLNANYIDRMRSYYLCLQNMQSDQKRYQGCCLEKLYKTLLHVRYHARHTPLCDSACQVAKELKAKTFSLFCSNPFIHPVKKVGLIFFYYFPFLYAAFMRGCELCAKYRK